MFLQLEYSHVCKVRQQRNVWSLSGIINKLKKPRDLCKRTSMTDLSLLSIPGTLTAYNNLEWCHHAGIMLKKTLYNEEKIRRKQIKKGKSN